MGRGFFPNRVCEEGACLLCVASGYMTLHKPNPLTSFPPLCPQYEGRVPGHAILTAGMLSSSVAQFMSYPLALTRTRLQAQGVGGKPVRYSGMVDVLRQTVRNEGVRGLYKGAATNLFKLAPAAGISWFVFEECKLLLGVDIRS